MKDPIVGRAFMAQMEFNMATIRALIAIIDQAKIADKAEVTDAMHKLLDANRAQFESLKIVMDYPGAGQANDS